YGGDPAEVEQFRQRMFGPYGIFFWLLITCNIALPQVLWLGIVRTTPWLLFIAALVINTGMWLERFVIVVTSLSRSFMPSRWGLYTPTFWDWSTFIGSIGLFVTL